MKLTFKVKETNNSVISLIKEMNHMTCRIFLDFENDILIIENINDSEIDRVIDLINNCYIILSVDIENTVEASIEEHTIPVVAETVANEESLKTTTKRIGSEASALLDVIGVALDKLDVSKKVEEQVEMFLTDIGMQNNEMVTQAFIVACDMKKINYENLLKGLNEKFPTERAETIKKVLKETFKNWLEKYPIIADKCHNISIIAIIKIFAKKFA